MTEAMKAEQEEARRKNILQAMADLANVGRTDSGTRSAILRHGDPNANKVSVGLKQDLRDARRQIDTEIKVQDATTAVERDFQCRREEGAIAIKRVLKDVYGATGLTLRETMFGDIVPPQEDIIIGVKEGFRGKPEFIYEKAAMYSFSLPTIQTEFQLDTWVDDDQTEYLKIRAVTKVEHETAIEGFCIGVERELRDNSIYKNKILSYQALADGTYKLEFLLRKIDPIFTYSEHVEERLQQSVWRILRHREAYAEQNMQTTFKVLLWGPAGTGKTGAGVTSQVLACMHGQTVLEYNPVGLPSVRDLKRCMALAKRLGPSMLFIEDYEKFFGDDTSNDRSAFTYLVDGSDKHDGISMLFTSNFKERIDPSMARAGRMTDAIEIGMLDKKATRELLGKAMGDKLAADVDFDKVWEKTKDFGPSFLLQCYKKARHVAFGLYLDKGGNKDEYEGIIGTEGLSGAAESSDELIQFFNELNAARAQKRQNLLEYAASEFFGWVKKHGHRVRLTTKGFSISE
jgi:SpoVK/Ycf46/Vps4 family AAA+-type ATPase